MNESGAYPNDKIFWQGKTVQIRQSWTENFYVYYPNIKKILQDFKQKLDYCERANLYQAMLVVGGTGAGKTALALTMSNIAKRRFDREDEEKTVRPCIQFAIPDPCTPFELSVSILQALGEHQPRARKNRAETISAAEKMLRICEVKLVLIDNVQDIPERRGSRGIEMVGARLRNLIDASGALWVLLGTADASKVINGDEQLIRRVPYRAKLNYFGVKDKEQRNSFRNLLKEIDKWLPLSEPSCLQDPSITRPMFAATEGIFDRIVQLVDRAWFEACLRKSEVMEKQDLKSAFDYVFSYIADEQNPFSEGFVLRILNGIDEPFERLHGGEHVDK